MQEEEGLQLQLIETTAVSSHPLNHHCFFDGSTLIYLAGAHIVMVLRCLDSITFSKTQSNLYKDFQMAKYRQYPFKLRLSWGLLWPLGIPAHRFNFTQEGKEQQSYNSMKNFKYLTLSFCKKNAFAF